MSDGKGGAHQGGGVNISGGTVTVGGDILLGHDKIVGTEISRVQLDQILRPIEDVVLAAPPGNQPEAKRKLEGLKAEAANGKNGEDSVVAKLVEGLIGLVPSAVISVVSAFATPLLGGIAGPVTKYVLDEIQRK